MQALIYGSLLKKHKNPVKCGIFALFLYDVNKICCCFCTIMPKGQDVAVSAEKREGLSWFLSPYSALYPGSSRLYGTCRKRRSSRSSRPSCGSGLQVSLLPRLLPLSQVSERYPLYSSCRPQKNARQVYKECREPCHGALPEDNSDSPLAPELTLYGRYRGDAGSVDQ